MSECYRHRNTYMLLLFTIIALRSNINSCIKTGNLLNHGPNNKINCMPGIRYYTVGYLLRFKPTSTGKFRIKPKTNKSIAKRFKITGSGKLMHKRSGRQHLRIKLKNRQKRRLKRPVVITSNRLRKKYLQAIFT